MYCLLVSSSYSSAPSIAISPQQSSLMLVQSVMEVEGRMVVVRHMLVVSYSRRAAVVDFVANWCCMLEDTFA